MQILWPVDFTTCPKIVAAVNRWNSFRPLRIYAMFAPPSRPPFLPRSSFPSFCESHKSEFQHSGIAQKTGQAGEVPAVTKLEPMWGFLTNELSPIFSTYLRVILSMCYCV